MKLAVFDAEEIVDRLPMQVCIDLMEQVQRGISGGAIDLPLRTLLNLPNQSAAAASHLLLVMPGALTEPPVFGAKLLSLFPDNPGRSGGKLPVVQGSVLLFDNETGLPIALVEAAKLTAIRTAAASAAATRALARRDASSLAILGYGVQAATHLEAISAVRPLSDVRVWGPDRERANAFAEQQNARYPFAVRAVLAAEDSVRGAHIVCAVSAAREPILLGQWLAPGSHVNLVGAATPDTREADGQTLQRARIFTEVTEFAMAEAGDILLAIEEGAITADQIAGEIGAVFGGALVGRESSEQITLYKSLGNTAQDLAAAWHVYRSAV